VFAPGIEDWTKEMNHIEIRGEGSLSAGKTKEMCEGLSFREILCYLLWLLGAKSVSYDPNSLSVEVEE